MKLLPRFLPLVLMCCCTGAAFAQHDHTAPPSQPAPTAAQQSFKSLKALAGSWEGPMTTTPKADEVEGKLTRVSLRVTSMGNLLLHEMRVGERPDDPITTIYLDGDQLMLRHYCDAGNRPRMTATTSPDGKTVDFDFVDISGGTKYGHMHHAKFTVIDADHHTEDWTYVMPDGKGVVAHADLQRKKDSTTVAAK